MLLPRPPRRSNKRRKLTLRLDEKPGDPQITVCLSSPVMKSEGHVKSIRTCPLYFSHWSKLPGKPAAYHRFFQIS